MSLEAENCEWTKPNSYVEKPVTQLLLPTILKAKCDVCTCCESWGIKVCSNRRSRK